MSICGQIYSSKFGTADSFYLRDNRPFELQALRFLLAFRLFSKIACRSRKRIGRKNKNSSWQKTHFLSSFKYTLCGGASCPVMGAVFKTVGEIVRAVLGWFDSDTPPPIRFVISDFGLMLLIFNCFALKTFTSANKFTRNLHCEWTRI